MPQAAKVQPGSHRIPQNSPGTPARAEFAGRGSQIPAPALTVHPSGAAGNSRPALGQSGRSAGLDPSSARSSPSAPAGLNPRNSGGQPRQRCQRRPSSHTPQFHGLQDPTRGFPATTGVSPEPHRRGGHRRGVGGTGGAWGVPISSSWGSPPRWQLQLSPRYLPGAAGGGFRHSRNWGVHGEGPWVLGTPAPHLGTGTAPSAQTWEGKPEFPAQPRAWAPPSKEWDEKRGSRDPL